MADMNNQNKDSSSTQNQFKPGIDKKTDMNSGPVPNREHFSEVDTSSEEDSDREESRSETANRDAETETDSDYESSDSDNSNLRNS